jgi:hypothetical protein
MTKTLGEQLFDSYNRSTKPYGSRNDKRIGLTYPPKGWLEMNKLERQHWENIATNPQLVNRFN